MAQIFVSTVAHFFVSASGSKFHERMAHFFIDIYNKKAKKAQMSREGYCRAVLNGATVKEAPPADVPMLLRAMRQVGYNLDQTLKRFNTTNVPDMPQFRKGLEEIRAATKLVTNAYTSEAD